MRLFRLAILTAIVASGAAAEAIPEDIEIGETIDNAETSRAVELIIQRCAEAYRVQEMQAKGTLIYSSKFDEEEDVYSKKVTLKWQAPEKLFIETTSGTKRSIFNADGKLFTFISDQGRQYLQLPQSHGLAAFSENERAGELLQDFSGTISEATVAPLLFTPDPVRWLHTNVKRYVYEGEEEVLGHRCWRIKFVQENPEITVINWVDQASGLLRKVSIIRSFNDDGDAVESYADGYIASMQLIIWDEISTRTGQLKAKDFTVKIPSAFDEMTTATIADKNEGFWSSLLKIASADTSVPAPQLTRSAGNVDFDFNPVATMDADIGAMDVMPRKPGDPLRFVVALKHKGLAVVGRDGQTSIAVPVQDDWVLCEALESADDVVLLGVGRDRSRLSGYGLDGEHRWSYQLPRATLLSLKANADSISPGIYALYEEADGIRHLGADGTLLHANRSVNDAGALIYGNNTVFAIDDDAMWTFTDDLRTSAIHKIENQPGPVTWAEGVAAPIFCIGRNEDDEVVLENWTTTGEARWSMTVAANGDVIDSGAVVSAVLKVDDCPTTCAAVAVDTGIILITDAVGRLLYKGQVTADDIALRRTGNIVAANLHAADNDGDGIDELYTISDRQIMELKLK